MLQARDCTGAALSTLGADLLQAETEVIIHSYSEMFNITEFLASSLLPQGDAGIHRYSFRI